MKRNTFLLIGVFSVLALLSCVTPPRIPEKAIETIEVQPVGTDPVKTERPVTPPPAFDPNSVSEKVKRETMLDIAELVSRLNTIIRDQNYDLWLSYLTDDYKVWWSDTARLTEESQKKFLKIRSINLKTLKDYFIYVVTPSRQNSRVDDIDFISQNKVVAYAVISGERGVLYYLEKQGDQWKIGIGR